MSTIQDVQGHSAAASIAAAKAAVLPPAAAANDSGPKTSAPAPATDTVTISSAGKAASDAAAKPAAPPAEPAASAGKAAPQAQQQTAVQIAQDSPAQLATLAANGNPTAKRILAERSAANKPVVKPSTV